MWSHLAATVIPLQVLPRLAAEELTGALPQVVMDCGGLH